MDIESLFTENVHNCCLQRAVFLIHLRDSKNSIKEIFCDI